MEQSDTDREIEVLTECINQLTRLDIEGQRRALWWLKERIEDDERKKTVGGGETSK